MELRSFKTITYASAFQLAEALSPIGIGHFRDANRVFRGQPDADFDLIPSAYRSKGVGSAQLHYGKDFITVSEQVTFEARLLNSFLKACDTSGLAVPGDTDEIRAYLKDPEGSYASSWHWPPAYFHHLLAVAQHHGCPTCLLDWSRRGLVAAYFAAAEAVKSEENPSHFAVWELDTRDLPKYQIIDMMEVPGGVSRNLAAQAGVFTLSPIRSHILEEFRPYWIDPDGGSERSLALNLIKHIVPTTQASEMLEICDKFGVSGATLFPGYEGVGHQVGVWAATHRKLATPASA